MKTLKDYEYYRTDLGVLYKGDCLEILPLLDKDSVDLVLTDPPYDERTHRGGRFNKEIKFGNVSFNEINDYEFLIQFRDKCLKWILIFCPIETLGKLSVYSGYIRGGIWDRIVNSPQISGDRPAQACEGIAIFHSGALPRKKWNGGGKAGIWRHMVERGQKQHETQKPLSLFKELIIDFSNENDLVLDPFFGSGTTGLACEKLGRKWIGIEISEEYCKIAKKRIKAEADQLKLFK